MQVAGRRGGSRGRWLATCVLFEIMQSQYTIVLRHCPMSDRSVNTESIGVVTPSRFILGCSQLVHPGCSLPSAPAHRTIHYHKEIMNLVAVMLF